MGMMSRMATIVKSKMNRVLDNIEDPRETLDYSYEKQLELLRNVKRGVVEMGIAKRRLEMHSKAGKPPARLQALESGREELALEGKQAAVELQGLDQQSPTWKSRRSSPTPKALAGQGAAPRKRSLRRNTTPPRHVRGLLRGRTTSSGWPPSAAGTCVSWAPTPGSR